MQILLSSSNLLCFKKFNEAKTYYKGSFSRKFTNTLSIANLLKIDYWTTIVIYKGKDELAREIGLYKENDIYNLIKKGI